jgi:hypothetical protein
MKPRYGLVSLVAIALGACSSAAAPPNDSTAIPSSPSLTASPVGAPVSTLRSCGEATVTLADSCPARASEGMACLAEAAATCQAADYVQTSQTEEGGTVVSRYTVQPQASGCAVIIETDWRGDPFGPAPKTKTQCRSADLALATSGCKVLHTIDCGEDVPAL